MSSQVLNKAAKLKQEKSRKALHHRSEVIDLAADMQEMLHLDVDAVEQLFALALDQTEVDFPLCIEHATELLDQLDKTLQDSDTEIEQYKQYILELEAEETRQLESRDYEAQVTQIEKEEKALQLKLDYIIRQRGKLHKQMQKLQEEEQKINALEQEYWQMFTDHLAQSLKVSEERRSILRRRKIANNTLVVRRRTYLLNDAFHIWHDGHFATINGCRMGRLPSTPVDWNEINAAWGLTALLVKTIAEQLGLEFTDYTIVPCGSQSKIAKKKDNSSCELYGERDLSIIKLFWYRRLDNGMTAFLRCIKELCDYIEAKDITFKASYRIENDKIDELSTRLQFNSETVWTKGLKYMLTNIKSLLAWMAHNHNLKY